MYNAIAHHPLTNAKPVPKQQSLPHGQLPHLYTEHTGYGISLWPIWISCLGCAPSQLLVHLAEHGRLKSP